MIRNDLNNFFDVCFSANGLVKFEFYRSKWLSVCYARATWRTSTDVCISIMILIVVWRYLFKTISLIHFIFPSLVRFVPIDRWSEPVGRRTEARRLTSRLRANTQRIGRGGCLRRFQYWTVGEILFRQGRKTEASYRGTSNPSFHSKIQIV